MASETHTDSEAPQILSLDTAAIEGPLAVPATPQNLLHLLHHVCVIVKPVPGVMFEISVSECSRKLYTPVYSLARTKAFLDRLPVIPIVDLAEDDRKCPTCLTKYGEPGTMLNSEPEDPVRLPCKLLLLAI